MKSLNGGLTWVYDYHLWVNNDSTELQTVGDLRNIVETNNTAAVFKIVSISEFVSNSTEFEAAQDVANTVNLFQTGYIPYQIVVKAEAGNIKTYSLQ